MTGRDSTAPLTVRPGLRPTGDRPDTPAECNDSEPVSRGGKIREPRPPSRREPERPDRSLRSLWRLPADGDDAACDRRRTCSASRRRKVGHAMPAVRARVVRLDRGEVRVVAGESTADRVHPPAERGGGEVLPWPRPAHDAPAERPEVEREHRAREPLRVRPPTTQTLPSAVAAAAAAARSSGGRGRVRQPEPSNRNAARSGRAVGARNRRPRRAVRATRRRPHGRRRPGGPGGESRCRGRDRRRPRAASSRRSRESRRRRRSVRGRAQPPLRSGARRAAFPRSRRR